MHMNMMANLCIILECPKILIVDTILRLRFLQLLLSLLNLAVFLEAKGYDET
jgi:hypothetical protein